MSSPSVAVGTPAGALDLRESVTLEADVILTEALASRWEPEPESLFDAKGRVPIHIIRPGIGKGRGRHLYEASMLQENAQKFTGWRMYVDHQSPEAKKASGGLPRSLRDAGGVVKEAFWDPDVPADPEAGHGQGAVIGLVKPTRLVRELIEDDPEIVEASISAQATGVRPVTHEGQKAWLVEGIEDRGSVDWVTEAGAGGRVVALMEAAYHGGDLTEMSDDDFRDFIADVRPNLLAEAGESEEDDVPITPASLQEAFAENPNLLVEALQATEAQEFVRSLVEAAIDEEREVIRAEARAEAQREVQLRDLRDEAHRVIAESKLPPSWQDGLKSRFDLVEGRPTDDLNVVDEVDDEGNVVKAAIVALRESLEEQIKMERERLREASPTRVRGQGVSGSPARDKSGTVKPSETNWGRFLQENAQVNPDSAYSLRGAGDDA